MCRMEQGILERMKLKKLNENPFFLLQKSLTKIKRFSRVL